MLWPARPCAAAPSRPFRRSRSLACVGGGGCCVRAHPRRACVRACVLEHGECESISLEIRPPAYQETEERRWERVGVVGGASSTRGVCVGGEGIWDPSQPRLPVPPSPPFCRFPFSLFGPHGANIRRRARCPKARSCAHVLRSRTRRNIRAFARNFWRGAPLDGMDLTSRYSWSCRAATATALRSLPHTPLRKHFSTVFLAPLSFPRTLKRTNGDAPLPPHAWPLWNIRQLPPIIGTAGRAGSGGTRQEDHFVSIFLFIGRATRHSHFMADSRERGWADAQTNAHKLNVAAKPRRAHVLTTLPPTTSGLRLRQKRCPARKGRDVPWRLARA